MVKNCNLQAMAYLEPMCSGLYVEDQKVINDYIKFEQPNTNFDLKERIKLLEEDKHHDILIEFDFKSLDQESMATIQQLPAIIKDSGRIGNLELGPFKLLIISMKSYERDMTQPIKKYK